MAGTSKQQPCCKLITETVFAKSDIELTRSSGAQEQLIRFSLQMQLCAEDVLYAEQQWQSIENGGCI